MDAETNSTCDNIMLLTVLADYSSNGFEPLMFLRNASPSLSQEGFQTLSPPPQSAADPLGNDCLLPMPVLPQTDGQPASTNPIQVSPPLEDESSGSSIQNSH